ncbi:copper homeostasis protein CutC [Buchananella hordeovulneris]|uniref:copper homeostasis protein CutC n=1 Tax=Buchananella hordeovulneris TaxID=52770 RepID=UPI000F5E4804|nr:copper homeostasis protein CutC [Buchananella hordeovulneris]RRD42846.1 copper homeostasis protein CutC [Buchananella hordeovulneris]
MPLEIAVQDVAGVRIAAAAGADRVELCSALQLGGLTPSLATIEQCVGAGLPVQVLIRPRGGGFVHTPAEIDLVTADIRAARAAGAAGVVVGGLVPASAPGGYQLDLTALATWRRAAGAADFVVHRCVDVLLAADPAAIDQLGQQLANLGVTRVLTSGGAARVGEGLAQLAALVQAAPGVEVQAGGGARLEDFAALATAGVPSVHLSCRATSTAAGPAGPGGGPAAYDTTDPEQVAAAVAAARAAGLSGRRAWAGGEPGRQT